MSSDLTLNDHDQPKQWLGRVGSLIIPAGVEVDHTSPSRF